MIIEILGINVKLESDNAKFLDFVKSSSNNSTKSKNYDVLLDIKFNSSLFKKNKNLTQNQLITEYFGSELYINDDAILWESKKLKVFIKKNSSKFDISAIANYRLDQKIRALFTTNPEFENNLFLYVHRFVVLYPVISFLSNKKKYSLVHASAVFDTKINKALLFIGLNGVGKSSLAFGLSNTNRFKLLSDNFILISKDKMLIVPELIRLPKNFIVGDLSIVGKANNKILIKNNNCSTQEYQVGKVVFVSRDKDHNPSTLKSLSIEKAFNIICNIGSYLKEYENFHYTAFLQKNKVQIDIENYKGLIEESQNYLYKIGNEKNNEIKFLQLLEG